MRHLLKPFVLVCCFTLGLAWLGAGMQEQSASSTAVTEEEEKIYQQLEKNYRLRVSARRTDIMIEDLKKSLQEKSQKDRLRTLKDILESVKQTNQ